MTDDQIRDIFGSVPHFADQVIEKFEPLEDDTRNFITSSYWSNRASLNLLDVCGTRHPDYAGMTWREFLSRGKRMSGNLKAFQENPEYYTDAAIHRVPTMYFYRINGKTFISDDGNHRTCIGKFYLYGRANPYIHGVELTETVVDWYFLGLYRHFLRVAPKNWCVRLERENYRREDSPGWKRDYWRTMLHVTDTCRHAAWKWNREQLERELPDIEGKTRKWWNIFARRSES